MTISKRWIQRGVLCGLLMTGVVGCSTLGSPPVGMVAQKNHAALAAWYGKEAAELRQKAKDMEDMEVAYGKNPGFVQGMAGAGGETNVPQHCGALIATYTKAAEEADELARDHRSMVK